MPRGVSNTNTNLHHLICKSLSTYVNAALSTND